MSQNSFLADRAAERDGTTGNADNAFDQRRALDDAAAGAGRRNAQKPVMYVNIGAMVDIDVNGEVTKEFVQIGGFAVENLPGLADPAGARTKREQAILEVRHQLRDGILESFEDMEGFERRLLPNLCVQTFLNTAMADESTADTEVSVKVAKNLFKKG